MSKNNNRNQNQPQRIQPTAPPPNAPAAATAAPVQETASNAGHQAAPVQDQSQTASSAARDQNMPTPEAGGIGADDVALAPERDGPEAQRGPGQRTRVPFGGAQAKLSYPPRPGFYRYWFRDDPGRIDRAIAAGYTAVTEASGEPVVRHGGVDDRGGAVELHLMEQPMHWHEEDEALAQKPVDDMDAAIRGGAVGREHSGADANVGVQADGHKIKISKSSRGR